MAQEICNRVSKDVVRGMGPNKTAKAMTRASKAAAGIQQIVRRVNDESDIKRVSQVHSQKSSIEDELMIVKDLRKIKPFERKLGRSHAHFDQMQVSPTSTIDMKSLFLWLEKHLNNSLKIHEENTKKITAMSVALYVIKFHVNLHKL